MTNPPRGSLVWKFLVSCRNVITYHLIWQIGNGAKAKFWVDLQDGEKALLQSIIPEEVITTTQNAWGDCVLDLVDSSSYIPGQLMKQKDPT